MASSNNLEFIYTTLTIQPKANWEAKLSKMSNYSRCQTMQTNQFLSSWFEILIIYTAQLLFECTYTQAYLVSWLRPWIIRGASSLDFQKSLGFCPNRLDPPSPKAGTPKTKKKWCLFFILGYSKHIIFFHEKVPFFWWLVIFNGIFGDFLVGTGEPPLNNIMNWWDIASPFV